MAQAQILDFLKKHPDIWFNTRDIAISCSIEIDRVRPAMQKLVLWDFVEKRFNESGKPFYKYKGSIQWLQL